MDDQKSESDERGSRLTQGLGLLADMGRDFADTRDIEGTLARALARICDYLNAEGGALFLLEDEGRVLRCETSVGVVQIDGLILPSDHGVVGNVVRTDTARIVRDVASDPNFNSTVDDRTGFTTRSILCAPMSVKDECIGAIELINKHGRDGRFEPADLALLEILCSSAAMALVNARLTASLVVQERMQREIELAAEIQRNLLPTVEEGRSATIFGLNIPARAVSGDFYDYFDLPDGRIAWCIADVSGKGINAALLMAKTASLYRCLGKTEPDPSHLLARINNEICETATRGMFVTLIGGTFDPATQIVCFANAGHEPPLFRTRDGVYRDFPAEAPPLGILPSDDDGAFPLQSIELDGGAFYVFTDGATEGTLAGGVALGAEGIKRTLSEHADEPLQDRLNAIVRLLAREDGALHDDITLLGIDGAPSGARHDDTTRSRSFTYRFAARGDLLQGVRTGVRKFLGEQGVPDSMANDLVLVIDEACQNIIRHAYGGNGDGEIVLELRFENREDGCRLVVLARDFAPEIDAVTVRPRRLDDARPGGLGTHFMREIMDEVAYLRPGDGIGNLLRMTKDLAPRDD